MYRVLLIIGILTAGTFRSIAQEDAGGAVTDTTVKVKLWSLYAGYVITRSNDTIKGFLLLKNLELHIEIY